MSLTLHYQRPFDEKTPFPYRVWEGETEIESGIYDIANSDGDAWDEWSGRFDNIVSFRSLVAHTEPHIERGVYE